MQDLFLLWNTQFFKEEFCGKLYNRRTMIYMITFNQLVLHIGCTHNRMKIRGEKMQIIFLQPFAKECYC